MISFLGVPVYPLDSRLDQEGLMIPRYAARVSAITIGALLWSLPLHAYHGVAGGPIIVNGQEPDARQGQALMQLYGPIPAGSYWYDPVSGLWGPAGGPSTGQILPKARGRAMLAWDYHALGYPGR